MLKDKKISSQIADFKFYLVFSSNNLRLFKFAVLPYLKHILKSKQYIYIQEFKSDSNTLSFSLCLVCVFNFYLFIMSLYGGHS